MAQASTTFCPVTTVPTSSAATIIPALRSGKDQLFGRGGNDQLLGYGDNDRLDGGLGRDTLVGGAGLDVFDYNVVAETGKTATTRDIITDFVHLTDDIDLSTIDANGAAIGNTAFLFVAAQGTTFTGVKGQLRWFQENPLGTVNDGRTTRLPRAL